MPNMPELRGLWRRSLIVWPDGRRDATTEVRWLQGLCYFADLRQPALKPDFSHAQCLDDLNLDDCRWLAAQQGFAGRLDFDGTYFEWSRLIDLQPKSASADAGSLHWEDNILVEEGRDISYVEHWHREPHLAAAKPDQRAMPAQHANAPRSDHRAAPTGALWVRDPQTATSALLLRVGDLFMFARDRAEPLPIHSTLETCVAAATLPQARLLLDCEISFGVVSSRDFLITASTLPFRIGRVLGQSLRDGYLITQNSGAGKDRTRRWEVLDSEGEVAHLDSGSQM